MAQAKDAFDAKVAELNGKVDQLLAAQAGVAQAATDAAFSEAAAELQPLDDKLTAALPAA